MAIFNANNFVSNSVKSIHYPFGTVEYIDTYYPVRYSNVSDEDVAFRSSVWAFKDGTKSVLTNGFYNFIKDRIDHQMKAFPGEWGFLAAPASSSTKCSARYDDLISWLRTKFTHLELLNDYVVYTGSREPCHKTNCRKSSGLNEIFSIGKSVKGMNIVIFDDIVTSGRTMGDLAQKLRAAGANKIFFCALGVTVHEKALVRA